MDSDSAGSRLPLLREELYIAISYSCWDWWVHPERLLTQEVLERFGLEPALGVRRVNTKAYVIGWTVSRALKPMPFSY